VQTKERRSAQQIQVLTVHQKYTIYFPSKFYGLWSKRFIACRQRFSPKRLMEQATTRASNFVCFVTYYWYGPLLHVLIQPATLTLCTQTVSPSG